MCPEVWRMTFGVIAGYVELQVLDSAVSSPALWDLGAWLEWLVAESTRKE